VPEFNFTKAKADAISTDFRFISISFEQAVAYGRCFRVTKTRASGRSSRRAD